MGNQSTKHHLHAAGGGPKPKKFVHWKSAERPFPPGRPILIPLSDQQPDVITLKWNRPTSDGGSPVIGFIIEHRRTGSPHWVRAIPGLVPRNEISISGLEPGWRYQFRVIAENIIGKSDPSELSDPLTVTLQRNAISVPRFIEELRDTTAVENERIELRVTFIGHPPPEINWFKDGFEIFSSRRTKIVNENDSSTLIIHQAAFTDEGEIKCTATNRAGHVVTKAHLAIEAPPKIRLPRQYEDGLIFEAEEVVRLKVGVAGQPAPSVVWCHEGETINNGGRFEMETTEKNSSLKIANIKRADRGEYSVKAVNKLGEDVASFLVTVTSRPDPPAKVKLQMSFGRSATLTWEAPSDDGGCKIGNYIIEYFRIGWNVWLKAATTRKQTVTLHDLIEGSEYKFRIKAENPYGLSDPSVESDVLFIPDPSRGITKPQQIPENAANEKPIPPKRKNLSPLRNILGKKKDSSPNRQPSPSRNPGLLSKMYDSEDIKREMSYGTSNDTLMTKDSKKPKQIEKQLQANSSPRRSPSPSRKEDVEGKEMSLKPETLNQKVQNFFRLSPRSARKSTISEETQTSPRASPSLESAVPPSPTSPTVSSPNTPLNVRPEIHRVHFKEGSASPIIDHDNKIQQTQNASPGGDSTNRVFDFRTISPQLKQQQQQSETINRYPKEQQPGMNGSTANHRRSLNVSGAEDYSGVEAIRNPRLSLPNPRIEISEPSTEIETPSTQKPRNNVHNSSEFMLVLYTNQKSQEESKQDSFELDLEESLAHPQLSLSAPDLGSDMLHLHELRLRKSASSTELLYERAMARFYEAVELEEAEKAKRLHMSDEPPPPAQSNPTIRKRLGSMTEAERLSFERRSQLRRKLSEEPLQPLIQNSSLLSKWDSKECLNLYGDQSGTRRMEFNNNSSLETQESEEVLSDDMDADESGSEYGDDYTESTASSDSMEAFKMEMISRTHPPNPDLDTYHPGRVINEENFSPYRAPEPDQSSVVLHKPVPLPSPDFIPKPILKRPSIDSNMKDSASDVSEPTSPSPQPQLSSSPQPFFISQPKLTLHLPQSPSPQPQQSSSPQLQQSPSPQTEHSPSLQPQHSPSPQPQHSPSPQPDYSKPPQFEETKEIKSKSRGFKAFFKREKASSDSIASKNTKLRTSKESSPSQASPLHMSPNQSSLEKSPSPNQFSPKELSPAELSPRELSPTAPPRKQLSPKELSPKELSPPTANGRKQKTQEKLDAFIQKQSEINERINKQREEVTRKKLESSKSAEEETRVVVDYYSHIVEEVGSSRKDKKPLYLSGDDLVKVARMPDEEFVEEQARRRSIEFKGDDLAPNDPAFFKPRMSIVERLQTAHVQEKSKHALKQAKGIMGESQDVTKTEDEPQPGSNDDQEATRGRSTTVPKKLKKRGASSSRSRDTSALKIAEKTPGTDVAVAPKRTTSRSRTRNPSKSPGAVNRRLIKRDLTPDIRLPFYVPPLQIESRPQTPQEISEEAQEKIRSTVSYATDVGLFVVACWVYLFKDARLVIPILALMVYRQISEMIRDRMPNWLPTKKS